MKEDKDIIELAFSGKNITPDALKAKEVAEIISAYETSLLSVIEKTNPEINIEEVFISLVDITQNSAHLVFKPKVIKIIVAAALLINNALLTNNVSDLPYKSVESLNKIWGFTKRRNCIATISGSNLPIAQIVPEKEIKISDEFYYKGYTTIYGVVERIGGATPRIRLKLDNNTVIYSEINKEKAKSLGHKLYETVCFKGFARWRKDTFQIEDFKIDEIFPYKETNLMTALSDLSNIIGKYWDEVDNPNDFIFNNRYTTA